MAEVALAGALVASAGQAHSEQAALHQDQLFQGAPPLELTRSIDQINIIVALLEPVESLSTTGEL